MRTPYPAEYYEAKLEEKYGTEFNILPQSEWHGLRTWVNLVCVRHGTTRNVELKKIFNGAKSTWPCRQCYLDSLSPSPTVSE